MAHLALRLLGPMEISVDDQPVTTVKLAKARALLAYVTVERERAHPRGMLAGLLWPDHAEASALTSLRTALTMLRPALGEQHAEHPFLLIDRETVRLNPQSDYALDTAALDAIPSDRLPSVNSRSLQEGIDLYRGEFLEGFSLHDCPAFEKWLSLQREHYRQRMLEVIHHLAGRYLEGGAYGAAEGCARRGLALDPLDEEAHRQLMQALVLAGRQAEALLQYEICVRALADELGVAPSPETTSLYEEIRAGKLQGTLSQQGAATSLPISTLTGGYQQPADAGDVLAAPEGPRLGTETGFVEQPPSLDGLASEVFVGRQRELALLVERLEEARAGRGSLVLLAGEAGIGKTSILREFAAQLTREFAAQRARPRGGVVLWGRCFEGEWQPPYGPWVEILSEAVHKGDSAVLCRELGPGAPALARLVPEICAALPDLPDAPPLGPDEGRLRLYDAVYRFLAQIAQRTPLVLILDDLHWADHDSLQLLRYVARSVGRTRILLLGTYRDPEVGLTAEHPLMQTLAVMRREADCQHIRLHGLELEELTEYLAEAAGETLPQALVQAVYAETNGNPFYTHEVWRHLTEEAKILRREGRWSTDSSISELGIPEGVRQVVGRRMTHLGDGTNAVLRAAAGLGGELGLETLQGLVELPEEKLLDALDEALEAGLLCVVSSAPPRYDFCHAIVRHTVYEMLNPDRRRRLHRRIAEALERAYAGHEKDHAAEIAAQYYASRGLPGAEKGVPYALLAAEQARTSYAHTRTVTFLRQARDLAPRGQPALGAEILCKLALAEADALLLEEARRSVEDALAALSAAATDPRAQAEFLAQAVRALKDGGAKTAAWEPLLERGLALLGEGPHDLLWARLTLLRNRYEHLISGPLHVGHWLGLDPEAVVIARASGDEDAYARTLEPIEWRTRQETEAVLAIARSWKQPTAIMRALDVVGRDLMYRHGALREGGALYAELLGVAERYGSIPAQTEALFQITVVHMGLGDLPSARQTMDRVLEMVARLGEQHRLRATLATLPGVVAYFLEGDWPALAAELTRFATDAQTAQMPGGIVLSAYAIHDHVRAGNEPQARSLLAALIPILESVEPTMYLYNVTLHLVVMAVWELGAAEYAATCRRLLSDLVAAGLGSCWWGPHELMMARMAALCGHIEEAERYFGQARAWTEAQQHRYLAPIIDYDEALALVRVGAPDHARIKALLDRALAAFRVPSAGERLEMRGWEQRALVLQEHLATTSKPPSAARTTYPGGLTAREVEVLRLLAGGLTNKEIAERLVVSIPTVARHITNIYTKIDAHGRADATVYALRHGLAGPPPPE